MTTDEKRQFLQSGNATAGVAVVETIVNLIAEGYSVVIEPTEIENHFTGSGELPAFKVAVFPFPKTTEDAIAEGVHTWLMQALRDAYAATPETDGGK